MTIEYKGALTAIGQTKQAQFLGGASAINITHMAIGDGNGAPIPVPTTPTGLAREVYRAVISRVYMSGGNAVVEMIVDNSVGPFWVRELAAIDSTGAVIAVANTPETFKPNPATGASRRLVLSMAFAVTNANVVSEVVMDSSAVLATRAFVDSKVAALPTQWPDSAKLGGQVPAYFATASDLSTLNASVAALSNLLFKTGMELGYWGTTAPAGWVMGSGKTIGNAASGGTERANADTEALFTMLWNSTANTELPIQDSAGNASTRGASAAADFAANKRLPLPDHRGRTPAGKDDMGGTAANRLNVTLTGTRAATTSGVITGLSSTAGLAVGMQAFGTGIGTGAVINSIDSATQVTLSVNSTSTGSGSIRFGIVDGATLAAAGGSQIHTLTTPQMPSHSHTINSNNTRNTVAGGSDNVAMGGASTISTNATGGGQAHPNVQPTIIRNVIIKL